MAKAKRKLVASTPLMKMAAERQNLTLRTAIAAGVASGPGKSAAAVFDRLGAKYRKLARKRH